MIVLYFLACGESNHDKNIKQEPSSPSSEIACDDSNENTNENNDIVGDDIDENCDGHDGIDSDLDGFASKESGGTDCNDIDPEIHPTADEICDGIDNNCSGFIDEADENWDVHTGITLYRDQDDDGYGNVEEVIYSCSERDGYVDNNEDCDDSLETGQDFFPNNVEFCDALDNDCDGLIDDQDESLGPDVNKYYRDLDGDGYGSEIEIFACSKPEQSSHISGDCDDGNDDIFPNALEICDDIDNDCDDLIDDEDDIEPISGQILYIDADLDGFGNPVLPIRRCLLTDGYVEDNTDCNDDPLLNGFEIHPDADEICDDIDNNCDEIIDDDAIDQIDFYPDADNDGHVNNTPIVTACIVPEGFLELTLHFDCDDSNDIVFVGAPEICDGIDNDCDELIDDQDEMDLENLTTFYLDADKDGYGSDILGHACSLEFLNSGTDIYVTNDEDCDDGNPDISPLAQEICDSVDNDCNEQIDDQDINLDISTQNLLYIDSDQDGLGDPTTEIQTCLIPEDLIATANYVYNNLDCNDNDGILPFKSNFFLEDINTYSASEGAIHSLCDYFDQVSGWYFLHGT